LDSELIGFSGVGYAYPGNGRLARAFPALRGQALSDLTFSVKSGSATALLGGNGSGKSTLLQLCNGLLAPDTGTVAWEGSALDRSRRGLTRLRGQVGFLFQDPDDQLFAGTVHEDVAFGPLNQGLSEAEVGIRVEESLEAVGLLEYARLPPHLLSHGMRKRAALAGVLALRPRLLLLDEPTAGLDPASQERLLEILDGLVAAGTTVLLSTHDLELAGLWAREALVLGAGRLLAHDKIEAVLTNEDLLVAAGIRRRRR